MISRIALAANGLMAVMFAYMFALAPEELMKQYGIVGVNFSGTDSASVFTRSITKYYATVLIFAGFVLSHPLAGKGPHKATVKLGILWWVLMSAVSVNIWHTSPAGQMKDAGVMNIYLCGAMLALNVLGFKTYKDPEEKEKEKEEEPTSRVTRSKAKKN